MSNDRTTTRQLAFNKTQISYRIIENKGKETVLMLHPAFTDHQVFESQIDYFKEDYQVIVIDMPGHGESQVIGSRVTLVDMPEIMNLILIENEITACHLIGVSLGSLVAQAFADRYPEQVSSVIIVGGYSIHKANARILKAQGKEGLKWLFYILFSMKKFRSYVSSVSCHTELGRDQFGRGSQRFTRRSFTAMAGMNSFFINKDTNMPYPLLIIVGEHDREIIIQSSIELHALEPNSQSVLLSGAGHCANVDAPNEFNAIVGSFLSELAYL